MAKTLVSHRFSNCGCVPLHDRYKSNHKKEGKKVGLKGGRNDAIISKQMYRSSGKVHMSHGELNHHFNSDHGIALRAKI